MIYKRKPKTYKIELYKPGMEDGFIDKGEPYIGTDGTDGLLIRQYIINEGDYIVTSSYGDKWVIGETELNEQFEEDRK